MVRREAGRSKAMLRSSAALALLAGSAASAQVLPGVIRHTGMGDASAAVVAGPGLFVVANDEDNALRVYRTGEAGGPVQSFDLGAFLRADSEHPEADIEGAARIGDRVYWIGSHGANKDGKPRPGRRRLFATTLAVADGKVAITPVGVPYGRLVRDLARAPSLRGFRLEDAAKKSPHEEGALNIEGLCATPQGALLIGFRSPIPGGKALVVPLENPADVVAGAEANLGEPVLLPLDGLGVRSIEFSEPRKKYLVLAGPAGDAGNFHLYSWDGPPSVKAERCDKVDFTGYRPEALAVLPGDGTEVLVLSDDGVKPAGGKRGGNGGQASKSPGFRSFRVRP